MAVAGDTGVHVRQSLTCVFRGSDTGLLVPCSVCPSRLKVFECSVFRYCTIQNPGGFKVCNGCERRQTKDDKEGVPC